MKEILGQISQNKNFLMLVTSIIYILGLFAYFTDNAIVYSIVIALVLIFLIVKNIFSYKIILFWFGIFYLAFFNAFFRITNYDELYNIAPKRSEIVGQVVSIPDTSKHNTLKFFVNVSQIRYADKVIEIPNNKTLVTLRNIDSNLEKPIIGNSYAFSGTLVKPFEATNPSQFSYSNYLKNYRVHTTFYSNDSDFYLVSKELSLRWKFIQALNNSRLNIIESHSKYLKSPNLEILGGIVFGDDAVSPPEYIKATFINSGLLHILAASGMNVAFIYGFLFVLLRACKVPYKLSVLFGIFVVILYSLMTGLGPSVVRAAIMLIFILLGKLIDRDAHTISLLAFVALLMLIYNPAYINDVGFQLSFIVTFGLLLCTSVLLDCFKGLPKCLSGAIFVPLIAQVWVCPIQMFYFNSFTLYSVFANILAVPFLSIISFGGFISSVFALFRPISDIVCRCFDFILNPMLNVLVNISNYFSGLPNSLLVTTHPSILQILIYYFILILLINLISIRFQNKNLVKLFSILCVVLCLSTINIHNKNFEIISFDVQNGDAFLLKTPQNKYIIIDTGKSGYLGGASKAKMVILKYLNDNGIKHIDSLVITHFDNDHAGGALDLIKNLNIKRVYVNSLNDSSIIAQKIYKASKNVILVGDKNNIIREDECEINLYCANLNPSRRVDIDNENSIITSVSCNGFRAIFTGDSGVMAFEKLQNNLPQNVTLLKVGHHGAKGVVNKNMIDYLNPKYSLISVGKNSYGHPNQVTLDTLKKSTVLRTDIDNSIKVVVNKKGYRFYKFDSKKRKYKLL